MSITSATLQAKLQQLLTIASMIDPKIALAAAGVEALTDLFSKTGDLTRLMDQVMAETEETAPDVARAVSEFYTAKGDALEASFRNRPGT